MQRFNSEELRLVQIASREAEDLVSRYYALAPREWVRMRYEVKDQFGIQGVPGSADFRDTGPDNEKHNANHATRRSRRALLALASPQQAATRAGAIGCLGSHAVWQRVLRLVRLSRAGQKH